MPTTIPSGSHAISVGHFNDTVTGEFAVDLVGPADAMDLIGLSTGSLDSLKFGTDADSIATANYSVTSDQQFAGEVVVAQTGGGVLEISNSSSFAAGGLITVNGGGTITLTNGTLNANGGVFLDFNAFMTVDETSTFNANGDITVDGGTFVHENPGLTLVASGNNLLATNSGQVETSRDRLFVDDIIATINDGADWTHTGSLTAVGNGTITVDGTGSTLVTGPLDVTNGGDRGVVNVRNNAQATVSRLDVGRDSTAVTTDAELNINTGGGLTVNGFVGVGDVDGNEGMGTINSTAAAPPSPKRGHPFLSWATSTLSATTACMLSTLPTEPS